MKRILVVTDVPWVRNEVHAVLNAPDYELVGLDDPRRAAAVVAGGDFDAAVVDLQVGSMGGMAVTRAIRDTLARASLPELPVVLLLDRSSDAFLAGRAAASGWVVKPFTAHELRSVVESVTPSNEAEATLAAEPG